MRKSTNEESTEANFPSDEEIAEQEAMKEQIKEENRTSGRGMGLGKTPPIVHRVIVEKRRYHE